MALIIGSKNADSGMSKSIYAEIDELLSPPLLKAIQDAPSDDVKQEAQIALVAARQGWQKLSYAIAKGVIDHIKANIEIFGIETQGDINTSVRGDTGKGLPNNHSHNVNLNGQEEDVIFIQSNDGTGHVK
jgi:hypothetical protein